MQKVREYGFFIGLGIAYIVLSVYFIYTKQEYLSLFPFALLLVYFAIFQTEYTFLSLAFLTPLSVNIEEFTDSFGLFIPTEPLLFGLMLFLIMIQLRKNILDPQIWKNPILRAVGFYIFWLLMASIMSSHPMVSFKFLLARLWFIVPVLIFGTHFYRKIANIRLFMWLFVSGMIIAILYTLVNHSLYGFGEKESYWVMFPFFKDHTVYGAIVALTVPLLFGIYFSRKHALLVQAILFTFMGIILIGLYFSYTRAAWLSIFAAIGVWMLIKFRVKFSLLAGAALLVLGVLFIYWDQIEMEMARNKSEHTTEEFGKRLESAANISSDASNLERINRWSCAISMFEERPVFGFGPGTYAFEYARFQRPENLTVISTNFGTLGNAHSEYLGTLAEAGFPGLIAFLCIVAALFYKGITLYYRLVPVSHEISVLVLSMILSLVTYFVHGVLNNYLDTDKAAVPIWSMAAIFIILEVRLNREGEKAFSGEKITD